MPKEANGKSLKNSKCNWKSLEAQSGMTHLVFSVDGPVGAGSSPDQNKSSGSGVKHHCPTTKLTHRSSTCGWGARARGDNKLLILSVRGAGCSVQAGEHTVDWEGTGPSAWTLLSLMCPWDNLHLKSDKTVMLQR